jgi:hypothetical protein
MITQKLSTSRNELQWVRLLVSVGSWFQVMMLFVLAPSIGLVPVRYLLGRYHVPDLQLQQFGWERTNLSGWWCISLTKLQNVFPALTLFTDAHKTARTKVTRWLSPKNPIDNGTRPLQGGRWPGCSLDYTVERSTLTTNSIKTEIQSDIKTNKPWLHLQ